VLILLAKYGNVTKLGEFTLALAVTAPVFQFSNLQLRSAQITDTRDDYAFRDYMGLRLLTSGASLVLIMAITVVARYGLQTMCVVLLIGSAKAFESISDTFQGLFQKHELMHRAAKSSALKGVLSVAAVGFVLTASGGVVATAASLAIAWLSVLVVYDLRQGLLMLPDWRRDLLPRFKRTTFTALFRLTLPLGFLMMLLSITDNLPRYFLARHGGDAAVGMFSALAYCVIAGSVLVSALGQSASPKLARHYGCGDSKSFHSILYKLLGFVAASGAIGMLLAIVAGRQILTLLYHPEYGNYSLAFVWLVTAGAVAGLGSVLGIALTSMRVFKMQAAVRLACAVLGLIASATLIPSMGILGAALTVLVIATAGTLSYAVLLIRLLSRLRSEDTTRVSNFGGHPVAAVLLSGEDVRV
jgi:O-antigen/teichoic acid export membrane protein